MGELIIRPYKAGEERYVAEAHRRVYAQEYHWGPAFTDYAAQVAWDFAKQPKNPREELWLAQWDGEPVGCILLCETKELSTGQLRLFLVEPDFRRRGVGSALTGALLAKARQSGYERLILWTASPLTAALRRYEALGFRRTRRVKNTTWSLRGEALDEIEMELRL